MISSSYDKLGIQGRMIAANTNSANADKTIYRNKNPRTVFARSDKKSHTHAIISDITSNIDSTCG